MIEKAIQSGYRYALVHDLLDDMPMSVSVKKNFDTACWSFNLKAQKHTVYVGDKILDRVKNLTSDIKYYIQSYLFHELSHSLHTYKNLKEVSKWCEDNKVPFRLFNLFEDARIEHLWREATKRKFNWLDTEELEEINPDTKPTGILFTIIQSENEYEVNGSPIGDDIMSYYNRAIVCGHTIDLYPILLEWMKDFPDTQNEINDMQQNGQLGEDNSSTPTGSSDLQLSEEMQEDENVAAMMDESSEDIVGTSPYKEEDMNINEKIDATNSLSEYTTEFCDAIYEDGYCGYIDEKLAKRYLPQFEKLFEYSKKKVNSASPSKRLNIRGIARGKTDKLYRREETHVVGNKVVNLIVDCSGSMSGSPIEDARTLVYLINSLSIKGSVSGNLVLTGADGYIGQTISFKLPVTTHTISSIIANGSSENIRGTFEKVKPLMKKADWNFVFTDGNINDEALDKKALNRQGIYTYGMYSGSNYSNLDEWFDKHIARETLKELMDELVRKLK